MKKIILILALLSLSLTSNATIGDSKDTLLRKANVAPADETIKDIVTYLSFHSHGYVFMSMLIRNESVAEAIMKDNRGPIDVKLVDDLMRSYSDPEDWHSTDVIKGDVTMCSPTAQVCMTYGNDHVLFILGKKWMEYIVNKKKL